MHIEISTNGVDRSDALDEHLRGQLRGTISRFEPRLTRIEAHLSDVNAGKSGPADKVCKLEARPRGMDPVMVDAASDDMYKAVSDAAGKLRRALERRFERNPTR